MDQLQRDLSTMPLFAGFSAQQIADLASLLVLRDLAAGQVLFLQGDAGHESFLVLAGELEVVSHIDATTTIPLSIKRVGEIVGEMALIDQQPRSATVRAGKASRVAVLDEAAFFQLLNNNASLAVEMLRRGTRNLRETSTTMIARLEAKNNELAQAYEDLKSAQEELIFLNRVQEEMNVARRIQRQFLPHELPLVAGWDMAAFNRGAQAVGGDFYDCIELPGGALGLIVADVCGKGVPAALFVALTRSLVRAASQAPWMIQAGDDTLLHNILVGALLFSNEYIARVHGESNMFITLFYGILDPQQCVMSYVNAGHNPPLMLRRADSSIEELESFNLPIGIIETETYSPMQTRFDPGDMLVAFSDGITEAMNAAGEAFDDERLLAVVQAHRHVTAQQLVDTVVEAVDGFAGSAPQADDMTLLVVQRLASTNE